MKNLTSLSKKAINLHNNLNSPFSIYSAYKEQKLEMFQLRNRYSSLF